MSNGLFRKLQAGFLAAVVSPAAIADEGQLPIQGQLPGPLPILRMQKDAARERGWMLTPRGVVVFDYKVGGTTAFVHLPEWVWAGDAFACPPDLALGPKGEAVISSNVVPTLWRIDPLTLRVTRHDLILDAHKEKDVGFTGLTYAAELGSFFAISDFGPLWRIDPLLRRAQEIALNQPIPRACVLTPLARNMPRRFTRAAQLCVHDGRTDWSITLAPDRRSAHVRQNCN